MTPRQRIFFIAVLFIASLLRIVALERVPYGINQDEAERGYEAYSLLTTGRDQHGHPWPLTLEAFSHENDNASAISAYAAIPTTAIFGPGLVATRLPSALAGVLLVWATILLGKRLCGSWNIGLLAGAALAVSPWHLTLSRLGHEAVWLPTLFSLGAVAYFSAVDRRPWLMPLAVLAWGAGFFGYGAGRLFFPLASILTVSLTFRRIHWRHPSTWVALGVVAVLLIPLLSLSANQLGAGHFQEISIFQNGVVPGLRQLGNNFLAYFNLLHWGLGQISVGPIDFLLFFFGIPLFFFSARPAGTERWFHVMLLSWLVAALLPAMLTDANPHQIRPSGLLSVLFIVGTWSIVRSSKSLVTTWLRFRWQQISAAAVGLALGAAGLVVFVQPSNFFGLGFGQANIFFAPEIHTLVARLERTPANEVWIVDDGLNQPQIFFMLLRPWNPTTLAKDHDFEITSINWYRTTRLGRYHFCKRAQCPSSRAGAVFAEVSTGQYIGTNVLGRIPLRGFSNPHKAWVISRND
ncbi:MAG: glycosyltransferase family 39 protein [Patescibacteria group bacterium]